MYSFQIITQRNDIPFAEGRHTPPKNQILQRNVRLIRLELTRPKAPDPKSGVSTNSTTSAYWLCKGNSFPAFAQARTPKNKKARMIFLRGRHAGNGILEYIRDYPSRYP